MNQNRSATNETVSPMQQAILDIRALRLRLEESERRQHAPIAIIGMACRFPGNADNSQSFWRLLSAGADAIGEIPADRWDLAALYDPNPDAPGKMSTRCGGFLPDVDRFDAQFFGISDREAVSIDPQHRLLLEVGWEALTDAGQPAQQLHGTAAGVFVGISSFDYGQLRGQLGDRAELDAYHATGIAHSAASGRLAYFLGLQGPCISIDTACSSSLVAVHLACQSLRTGECRLALVGGVNLILSPEIHVTLSKARMMAPDGRCKAFDDRADGFVRSEGCGVVVLKSLSDALADGDRIHAVIRGSACNQDGRSSGLTAPNGPSQTAVLQAAWRAAGVEAAQLDYVEAHGTGTALGDPIEAGALAAALEGAPRGHVLSIGSVKTNLGHMEAAAGIGGLIKVVLSLENEQLPASLHFQTPSTNVDWQQSHLKVVRENTPWPRTAKRRLAGVSSFGFSGTNVHIVLEESPPPLAAASPERSVHLLTLSASSEPVLRELAKRYAEKLRSSAAALADIAYTANAGRSQFTHRAAIVCASAGEAATALAALADSTVTAEVALGRANPLAVPEVVFVAGDDHGLPADWPGELYSAVPAFRAAIDQCARLVEGQLERPLVAPAENRTPAGKLGCEPVRQYVAAFALQWALAQTWRSWGVEPTALLGRGLGACVAGSLAGVFSLQDGLRLAMARAKLTAGTDGLEAARANLEQVAQSVRYSAPRLPLLSDVLNRMFAAGEIPDAAYWIRQAQEPSLPPGIDVPDDGNGRLFLQLGAVDALGRASTRRAASGSQSTWLPSLAVDGSPERQMLKTLAQLYVRGAPIDFKAVDRGYHRRLTELPGYPWDRQRYWFPMAVQPTARPTFDERWQAVLAAGNRQADQVPMDLALHTYADKYRAFDQLATAYIVRCFQGLGLFARPGATLRASDLLESYGVLPVYRILMQRWLKKLAVEGLLEEAADTYTAPVPLSAEDPERLEIAAGPLFADSPMLLDYVRGCGRLLTPILLGQASPLDTLFPGGSFELAEAIYHRAALSRYFNAIAGAVAGAFAQQHAGALRILEVGAGTGGTTASILPMLPADRTLYAYTDVSEFFFTHAARRFATFSGLKFGLLDLERSPESQGYPAGQYDLIVAANVLHATKDLGQTLDFVRSLLSAEGVLVLYEVTDPPSYFDVSIALIEGWQKFEDAIRDTSPLLTTEQWKHCLLEHGFQEIMAWPAAATPAEVLGSHVLVARATSSACAPATRLVETTDARPAHDYSAQPADEILLSLADAPESEHGELLVGFVRRHVARVLRKSSQTEIARDQRLMDLGLDSLMAVELRNNLSQSLQLRGGLPATLMFDYPSIADIAAYLHSQLRSDGAPVPAGDAARVVTAPRQPPGEAPRRMTAADLNELSDAEVERLLSAKLKQM